jgi:hypothetical protein
MSRQNSHPPSARVQFHQLVADGGGLHTGPMQATMKVLLDGYRAACARFDSARKELDEVGAFRAMFEALEWAVSIDEVIAHRWAPDGEPALGWEWRKRIPAAEFIKGLRWVRNRVHHHWLAALEINWAEAWYPPRELEFQWKPLDELPPAKGKSSDERGAQQYRVLLAGHSADAGLSIIDEVFEEVVQYLETPGSPVGLKGPFFEPITRQAKPGQVRVDQS